MFRRTKSQNETTASGATAATVLPAPGKGRPTPTRKEAEAAARARAKAALDPKASRKQQREHRSVKSQEIRAGMKAGDERYLPARDQGPVKRFVRDFVDHRLCMAEFAIPLLFSSLLASASGFAQLGTGIMNATMLVVVVDSVLLRFRLRRELKRRFPEESLKGTTFYAFMRALQVRFLRLPKPRVKLGQELPERY
ncbi:MAG TPA: DUF3043 domain-containing protein [Marmoricola sp.]|nr:DUF3043 domain-containing protein [Marmoricola sp.]